MNLTAREYLWNPTGTNGADGVWGQYQTIAVPEPGALAVLAISTLTLVRRRRRA